MESFLYFLVGVVVSLLLSGPGWEGLQGLRRHITWRRFQKCLSDPKVIDQLQGENKPDMIIGLNSGIVPASILALNLDISELVFLNLLPKYNDDGTEVAAALRWPPVVLAGKKIVIVDHQVYTGGSMDLLYKELIAHGVSKNDIRRFALFRYLSPAANVTFEIDAPGKTSGQLKWEPWVFSPRLKRFYDFRSRRGTR